MRARIVQCLAVDAITCNYVRRAMTVFRIEVIRELTTLRIRIYEHVNGIS